MAKMTSVVEHILSLHGGAALAMVFLLPALEASTFVGFLFPGEIAVLLGGVLAFEHRVPLLAVIAAAVAGAIVGDTIGYVVGKRWGRRILDGSIGRLVRREHLDRAEQYLAERGGKAVFLGRFTAALRALIPSLAGMAGLDYRTFTLNNAAGGCLWAMGFVLAGYVAGSGWRQVEHVTKRASLLLLAVGVAVALIVVAARRLAREQDRMRALTERQLARPWVVRLRTRYQGQLGFLTERLRPGGALGLSLTVTVLALSGAGWAFGVVLQDVLTREETALLDAPAQRFFLVHREAWLTPIMETITALGSSVVLISVVVVVGVAWWWRQRIWRPLAMLASAYAGAALLSEAVKLLTHRPRPPVTQAIGRVVGYAFPSGHATRSMAVYGMLVALLAAVMSRWERKVALWATAVIVVGLIGLSRLYLGDHWLTDVLGGYALGAAWLFTLLTLARTVSALPIRQPQRVRDANPHNAD
jgi:membrane protein DedA with SNARE-associated domain/membrane-associated phospholipid phosphatase